MMIVIIIIIESVYGHLAKMKCFAKFIEAILVGF